MQKRCLQSLTEYFRSLEALPDVFICASDSAAINAMHSLKELGYSIPDDIWLCGFGDSPESSVVTPSLTTVHVHSKDMASCASSLLLSRIRKPALGCRIMHTETGLVYRESTGD